MTKTNEQRQLKLCFQFLTPTTSLRLQPSPVAATLLEPNLFACVQLQGAICPAHDKKSR